MTRSKKPARRTAPPKSEAYERRLNVAKEQLRTAALRYSRVVDSDDPLLVKTHEIELRFAAIDYAEAARV